MLPWAHAYGTVDREGGALDEKTSEERGNNGVGTRKVLGLLRNERRVVYRRKSQGTAERKLGGGG